MTNPPELHHFNPDWFPTWFIVRKGLTVTHLITTESENVAAVAADDITSCQSTHTDSIWFSPAVCIPCSCHLLPQGTTTRGLNRSRSQHHTHGTVNTQHLRSYTNYEKMDGASSWKRETSAKHQNSAFYCLASRVYKNEEKWGKRHQCPFCHVFL